MYKVNRLLPSVASILAVQTRWAVATQIANELICKAEPLVLGFEDPAEGQRHSTCGTLSDRLAGGGHASRASWEPGVRGRDILLDFVQGDFTSGLRPRRFALMPITLANDWVMSLQKSRDEAAAGRTFRIRAI